MFTKKWILVASLVMALGLLSACTPADTTGTPGDGLGTDVFGTDTLSTDVFGTDTAPTLQPIATAEPTGAVGTEVVSPEPQMTSTPDAVATQPVATAGAGTDSPSLTTTPASTEEPVLIESDNFLGFEIMAEDGTVVGTVDEILVDDQGMIRYLLTDAGTFLGTTENHVAVPWEMFEVDTEVQQIRFMGTANDLTTAVVYDPPMLDELEGPIVTTTDTEIPVEFDTLIRVSRFQDFNLKNTEDEDTGEVEQLLIDLTQGGVPYAVVDFGGFLGLGEKRVAVPWDRLEVREDAATQADVFVLDASVETLNEAPVLDLNTLTIWPEPTDSNWDIDIRDFWETAG